MPFGMCSDCDHYYVLDEVPSPRWQCPGCKQWLREVPREEALTHLRYVLEHPHAAAALAASWVTRSGNARRPTVVASRRARKEDMSWQIEMLGWLRATRADQIVSRFRSQSAGALLAYLAYHPKRSHPREVLIDQLWPEADRKSGHRNLRTVLSSLRRQFEPSGEGGSVLLADGATLQLNSGVCVTDVAAFEIALELAAKAHRGTERRQQLAMALELYQGELLPGHYERWVIPERLRLTELFLQAVWQMVADLEEEGNLTGALRWAWRAVAADPLRQEAHADLMRLLSATGQPEAMVRQHQESKRLPG